MLPQAVQFPPDASEQPPQIRRLSMLVVQDYFGGTGRREHRFVLQQKSAFPCALGNPGERHVGHRVIILEKSSDIRMRARENQFFNEIRPPRRRLPAAQRHIFKKSPRFIAGYRMTGREHVRRSCLVHIQTESRVNGVPKTEIGNFNSEFVQPFGKTAGDKRSA